MLLTRFKTIGAGFAVLATLLFSGCGQSQPIEGTPTTVEDGGHVHGEWWCSEHGVPEEVCALCDPKVAAEFHKKGDWCEEHSRPDSQCFICRPELEAKFAAQYEAKYGEQPPKPSAGEDGHEHHDDHEHESSS